MPQRALSAVLALAIALSGVAAHGARAEADAVVVAVIDTGADTAHPTLAGRLWTGADGRHGRNVADGSDDLSDRAGHGTEIAATVAAAAPDARVMVLKAGFTLASINLDDVARAIVLATDAGAGVINLSIVAPVAPQDLRAAVSYARRRGVVLVAAAGNAGTNTADLPGGLPGVIRVGAHVDGAVPAFSNRHPDLVAPGAEGTSFAAAKVSAAAAVLRALRPDLTGDDMEALLVRTARDLGEAGVDEASGAGALDLDAARAMLMEIPVRQPPAPSRRAVSRAEFLARLLEARNVPLTDSIAANLVFDSLRTPYARAVATGKAHGLVTGRMFDPERSITRAEALELISRLVPFPSEGAQHLVPADVARDEQRNLLARALAAGIAAPWTNRELNARLRDDEASALLAEV